MKTKELSGYIIALLGILFPFVCFGQQIEDETQSVKDSSEFLKDNSSAITESNIPGDTSGVKCVAFMKDFPEKFFETPSQEDVALPPFLSMKDELASKGKTFVSQ